MTLTDPTHRYSLLMFATNPSMLDSSKLFPADWPAAPPELISFVAQASSGSNSTTTGPGSSPGTVTGSGSGNPSGAAADAANASPSSGAAGKSHPTLQQAALRFCQDMVSKSPQHPFLPWLVLRRACWCTLTKLELIPRIFEVELG